MPNVLLEGGEKAAWHRVLRRTSQLTLYPQAVQLIEAACPNHSSGQGPKGQKSGGKGAMDGKHQVANLMNLSLAAKTPGEVLRYLDHQVGREVLNALYCPLQRQFQEWKTTLLPQLEKDVLGLLGSPGQPAKALLHLTREALLLDVFHAFCQHARAHFDYLDATQGGH